MSELWLTDVRETYPMLRIYAENQCCALSCEGGECQECPCCVAGWCVFGHEGLPDDAGDLRNWLLVAVEHNPVVRLIDAKYVEGVEPE